MNATPREKTRTKRTLGQSLYREKGRGARYCQHFCQVWYSERAQNTILLSFLQIQLLNEGLGQELQESSGIGRLPGDRVFNTKKVLLEAFFGRSWGGPRKASQNLPVLRMHVLKKAPEHDTVVIFANTGAQKGPGARYCCYFCQFRCSKRARNTILL